MKKEERDSPSGGHEGWKDILTWPTLTSMTCFLLGNAMTAVCMGELNSPGKFVKDFMNETSVRRGDGPLSRDTLSQLYALLSAVLALGACVGALAMQKLSTFISRKGLLTVCACVGLGSALLMGLSKMAHAYEMLFVGRALSGLVTGVFSSLSPLYLAEIAPRHLLGPVMVSNVMTIHVASFLVTVIGYQEVLVTPTLWPFAVAFHGVMSVLQLLLLPWVVRSPYFLLVNQHDELGASQALQKLRGTSDVDKEMRDLQQLAKTLQNHPQMSVPALLRTPSLRRPLFISAMAHGSSLLTGVIVVAFYSVILLQSSGLSARNARYVSTGITVWTTVVTIVMGFVVQRARRRSLMLGGQLAFLLAGVVLTLTLVFRDEAYWVRIVGVVSVVLLVTFHAAGPGAVTILLIPELFAREARGAAFSVSMPIFWFSVFLVGYAFPPLQEAIGPYSFLPFVGITLFFLLFFFFMQPETLHSDPEEETITVDADRSSQKEEHQTKI